MIRHGRFEDEIDVLIDESDASIVVSKRIGEEWMVVLDYRARNLRVLAEHFSDAVGYGVAVELLTRWEVPQDSPLWVLNHKGGLTHFTDR